MDAIRLEQLRVLPRRTHEVWQGALVRMSSWVTEDDSEPFRPYLPIWHAVHDDKIHCVQLLRPDERSFQSLINSLLEFALDSQFGGYRPGTIQVMDTALAEHLQGVLGDCGISVQHVPNMNELDRVVADLRRQNEEQAWAPPLLSDKGVTIEHLREFAEAAAHFYRARPWELLTEVDPIRVEKPTAPKGMKYGVVLGAGQDFYGLGMYASKSEIDRVHRGQLDIRLAALWQVSYGAMHELPVEDAELWEDHQLPVAAEDAYPIALKIGPESTFTRPTRTELAFLRGLLFTIADASEQEIDSGRWERQIRAHNRQRLFRLAIPNLLRPPSVQQWIDWGYIPDRRVAERPRVLPDRDPREFQKVRLDAATKRRRVRLSADSVDGQAELPVTAKQQAQEFCYQAYEAFGRRRVQLARRALELDADCADAYVLRAEQAGTIDAMLGFYQRGMEAAERQLGQPCFQDHAGQFWQISSTRTYMCARLGAAQVLEQLGQNDAAIEHYQELLRLNPHDNQGVRHLLLPLLLKLDRDVEAAVC